MKLNPTVIFLLMLLSAALLSQAAWAESNLRVGPGNSQAHLRFAVTIPTILYLQVGTTGATVDTISFDAIGIPGSGRVEGYSSGAYPVPVRVAAMVPRNQRVTLSADSSHALTRGPENIRFDNINAVASGALQTRRFNNTVNQLMRRWTNSGEHVGTYRFYYDNDETHAAGIYTGRVTFTLSSP